ncbi:alpha/beta hydrolase family protein [Gordonia jinhuaensis]|uniref:S-formylglutathione hydrolase FrmB n=1 Tax=Gordonia jinhuaensis TaxID=1517702 RepID=A0A916TGA1_9ACTN|nr:hypothetical protein GCM10011489_34150 [Gordonia jinhuaensis]
MVAAVSVVGVFASGVVAGAPATGEPAGARVTRIDRIDAQLSMVYVYSPSMNRVVPNQVLRPAGSGSAPVLQLINGRAGGVEGDSWLAMTNHRQFFADKRVTVVSPLDGPFSWYTDWKYPDPHLGVNKWQTYLTRELPAAIGGPLQANGRTAVAGLSLNGGSALDIAGHAPWLYRAAASYSGCPAISSLAGVVGVAGVTAFGGGNAFNMFGPPGDPAWTDHDPSLHPSRLRGKAIYLGASTGIPGAVDGPPSLTPQLLAGPAEVEMITRWCTDQMAASLRGAGIGHTYRVFDRGAHTWSLFEAQLRGSWRVLGPALGA